MNIKRFLIKKDAGLADIRKIEGQITIEEKRFDKETGKEESPKTEFVDIKALLKKKEQYQKAIDEIDSFIAVVKAKYKTYISSLNNNG